MLPDYNWSANDVKAIKSRVFSVPTPMQDAIGHLHPGSGGRDKTKQTIRIKDTSLSSASSETTSTTYQHIAEGAAVCARRVRKGLYPSLKRPHNMYCVAINRISDYNQQLRIIATDQSGCLVEAELLLNLSSRHVPHDRRFVRAATEQEASLSQKKKKTARP